MKDLEKSEQSVYEEIKNYKETRRFYFHVYSQWSSFIFWRPVNWRDFTFINLTLETNPQMWIDIGFALLGVKISFTIFKK